MSVTFADAALERIAQCVGVQRHDGQNGAKILIDRYMSNHHIWWGTSENSATVELMLMGESASIVLFYRFGCLVEVGCAAGYIDLDESSLKDSLIAAIARFTGEEKSGRLKDLSGRLAINATPTLVNDQDAFHGFAAYLALNEVAWADVEFHALLNDSDEHWVEDKDAHFLLTPRHFAEALATGRVEGIDASAAAAGLRALEYFRSLAEFEMRAANVPGLFDKALRAARWAHLVADVDARMNCWRERMLGWRIADHGAAASDLQLVPLALRRRLQELGLARPARIAVAGERLDAEQLVRLGRTGEAQQMIERKLEIFEIPVSDEQLDEYIRLCLDLRDAGGREAAAARLARIESRLVAGGGPSTADSAQAMLRWIRTATSPETPEVKNVEVTGKPNRESASSLAYGQSLPLIGRMPGSGQQNT